MVLRRRRNLPQQQQQYDITEFSNNGIVNTKSFLTN